MEANRLLKSAKEYDIYLFCSCGGLRSAKSIAKLSRIISHTGDGYYYALVLLWLYLQQIHQAIDIIPGILVAYVIERLLYYSLKLSFKRQRPAQSIVGYQSLIKPADQFSFPSGHTSAAFLFATSMAVLFPGNASLIYLWATTVGLSRFLLGVHFASDILMGAVIGFLVGNVMLFKVIL
ncbi:MAG: phosphatase PAP2 family protein [Pseudomonadales bacterium]|nr:phosphatase PAP2 family protein [Pseudomonadales bacterium]